jgi:hypothetical protein
MESAERRFLLTGAGLAGLAALATTARAGTLDPPAGPVAPTGRTTQEIYDKVARTPSGFAEPRIPVQSLPSSAFAQFVISQAGSYYLSDNITGVSGKSAILIQASGVSLDLMGHSMTGVTGAQSAIKANAGLASVRISGGTLRSWPLGAIELVNVNGCVVTDIAIDSSGSYGIDAGLGSTVMACAVRGSPVAGILCTGVVAQCSVTGAGVGITCAGTVDSCVVGGSGTLGISAGGATLVTRCRIDGPATGIDFAAEGGMVRDCVLRGNSTARGVQALSAAIDDIVVDANVIQRYSAGVYLAGTGGVVSGNAIGFCTTGVQVIGSGTAVVTGNTVRNATTPFAVTAGSKVGTQISAGGTIPASASTWANFTE